VQVISGLVAGSVAQTGLAAPCQMCCTSSATPAPGTFVLNVVPPGTIRLLIQAEGYQSIERDVTVTFNGGPASIDFQLQPNK